MRAPLLSFKPTTKSRQQPTDERPVTPASVDEQATTATTQSACMVPVTSNPGKPPIFFEGGSSFIKQVSEWCLLAGLSNIQERINSNRLKQKDLNRCL